MVPPIRIDPKHSESIFVPVALDADSQLWGLALSGSAEATEYERGRWSVSADVLNSEGVTDRRVLPDSFASNSDAMDLVRHVNEAEELLAE